MKSKLRHTDSPKYVQLGSWETRRCLQGERKSPSLKGVVQHERQKLYFGAMFLALTRLNFNTPQIYDVDQMNERMTEILLDGNIQDSLRNVHRCNTTAVICACNII